MTKEEDHNNHVVKVLEDWVRLRLSLAINKKQVSTLSILATDFVTLTSAACLPVIHGFVFLIGKSPSSRGINGRGDADGARGPCFNSRIKI